MLRQDKNLVLVYNSVTLKPVAQMRTGNTPVSMAITDDQRYMIVGNDHSHLASVFDLETFETQTPILFPGGYPRWFVVAHGGIWAAVRFVTPADVPCSGGNPLLGSTSTAGRPMPRPTWGSTAMTFPPTRFWSPLLQKTTCCWGFEWHGRHVGCRLQYVGGFPQGFLHGRRRDRRV